MWMRLSSLHLFLERVEQFIIVYLSYLFACNAKELVFVK